MKKIKIEILFLILIFLLTNTLAVLAANEYKIYSNTEQIYFEINSPESINKIDDIIIDIYFNKDQEKYQNKDIYIKTSDLINKKGVIIPAKLLNITLINNISFWQGESNKALIKNNEEKVAFNLKLSNYISYYPPGEYRGNIIIGDSIYNIPIYLKLNAFAEVDIDKTRVHFTLDKPAEFSSNKEEIEIQVKTNLENWEVKLEFLKGMIHEDGDFNFPLENILYSKNNKNKVKKMINQNKRANNLISPQYISFNSFENNIRKNSSIANSKRGNYNLKLTLWADIRENWNCVKAGEYNGEIYLTFIENN